MTIGDLDTMLIDLDWDLDDMIVANGADGPGIYDHMGSAAVLIQPLEGLD